MFTGIIETTGKIESIEKVGANYNFTLSCPFTHELKIDQSLSHSGCCLTVVSIKDDQYMVNAIDETLKKTNLQRLKVGDFVNLERCTQLGGRLDGHLVQGHVDLTGKVGSIENRNGSFYVSVEYKESDDFTTVPEGSITLNGVSLTVAESRDDSFSVALIPYTWEHTNLQFLKEGDLVNLEFDIIGKYIAKLYKKQLSRAKL